MTRLAFAAAATVAALMWLWKGPWRIRNPRELGALGYGNARLQTISAALSLIAAVAAAAVAAVLSDNGTALLVGITAAAFLVQLVPRFLEAVMLASFRKGRDRAALFFLRRLRLLLAGGTPLNDAAREAAQAETDPAFGPVRAAVHAAANTRTEPLLAIARALAGSPVDTILGTATSAERAGSAAGTDLDDLMDRAVATLEDQRRLSIERLERSINTFGALVSMLPILPLLLSMISVLV